MLKLGCHVVLVTKPNPELRDRRLCVVDELVDEVDQDEDDEHAGQRAQPEQNAVA